MSSNELCSSKNQLQNDNLKKLRNFVDEVMLIEYEEKPNYNKLKFLLTKELLNDNIVPNKIFNF